jgi:hypothetical protein
MEQLTIEQLTQVLNQVFEDGANAQVRHADNFSAFDEKKKTDVAYALKELGLTES